MKYVEFMKRVVPLHDDLFDFFYEALPGYEEVGRAARPARLLGFVSRSRGVRLSLREHEPVGARDVRHAGHRGRRQAGHDRPRRDQPRHAHPARQLVLRRLAGRRAVRQDRSAGQPGRSAAPVEPDHDAAPAEARLRRQVHLGDVTALVRQAHRRAPGARHRRRPARALLGHGAGRQRRHRLRQGHRAQREDLPAEDRELCRRSSSSGRSRAGATRSSATARAPTFRPTRRPRRCTSVERASQSCTPAAPRPGTTSRCRTKASAAAFTRRCAACSRITW